MANVCDPCEWVSRGANEFPDRTFIRTPDSKVTYRELRELSGRIAAALRLRGIGAGGRVAVQVHKSVEAVLTYVACLRIGAIFVPISVACPADEFDYFVADADPRLVIVAPEARTRVQPLASCVPARHLETLGADGTGTLMELAHNLQAISESELNLGPDAVASIVYTSGTTGRSKGAMLTRGNLASNAAVLVDSWRFTSNDMLLHVLPLFHVHGLFVAINTALASGSGILLLLKFDGAAALKLLGDATVFMGVPTHYTRLLQEQGLSRQAVGAVRLFVSGSAPLLAETHREFARRTGHMILERYGMTETLMNTSNPYDGPRVPGSVGLPLPGVSVRVVGAEGQPVSGDDLVGTLQIKGPNVFAGYWRDPQKTRAEFAADGWFNTGDLGRIDSNGYVYIVGRAKDLVISGGFNVYPKEVEAQLDAVPGVLESAVFGVPHPDFGEGVSAAVVLQPGAQLSEAAIIEALRSRLSRYKVPQRVLIVPELPRNTMGKVQKNLLRRTYAALYDPAGGM